MTMFGGGYNTNKPLNLGSNPFSGFNSGFGNGFNSGFNTGGFGQQLSVEQWLVSTVENALITMIQTNKIQRQTANYVNAFIRKNLGSYISYLNQASNGFQGAFFQNQDLVLKFLANCIQDAYNRLADMERQNNNMINDGIVSNMMGNQDFNFNTIGANGNMNGNVGGYVPKTAMDQQVQNVANGVVETNTVPAKSVVNQQQVEEIVTDTVNGQLQLREESVSVKSDTPIAIEVESFPPEFNYKDSKTWSIETISKIKAIGTSDLAESIKTYLIKTIIAQEYWKTKNITWDFDKSLDIAQILTFKRKEREKLPVLKHLDTPYADYQINIAGEGFDFDTKSINKFSLSYTDTKKEKVDLIYCNITNDSLVPNEDYFIHQLTDGRLKDLTISPKSDATNAINIIQNKFNIALSIDYETTVPIDIPLNLMSVYHRGMADILKKYVTNHSEMLAEFYQEVANMINDIPRKFSERLDAFIVSYVNDAFTRAFRDLTNGVPRPPYIKSWMDLKYLIESDEFNPSSTLPKYESLLATILYHAIVDIFSGVILSTDTDADILTILDTVIASDIIEQYCGPMSTKVYHSWDKENDKDKFDKLKENLSKFSVISVNKRILVTTIVMDRDYVIDNKTVVLTPKDTHLSEFDWLAAIELSYPGVIHNAALIDDETCEIFMLSDKQPAIFKLVQTWDDLIGYILM